MHNQLKFLLFGFGFMAFLSLTGCAPATVNNPELSSAPVPLADSENLVDEVRVSTSSSSLEALRAGKEMPTGHSGPLKDIYFEFDSYTLSADARRTLKANAEWLKANPSARAEIEGHADDRGTNEYNMALGARRAQSAKDYLITLGISSNRLSSISFGEELPVCREKTKYCWQKNRRVHSATTLFSSSS
jgi:peptidoglycan-associated lipoprotein